MKKNISYLELIIHHSEYSLYEYPSRFAILRIPFDSIHVYDSGNFIKLELSEHQILKLKKIGFDFLSYIVIPRRPCDKVFCDIKNINLSHSAFRAALYRQVFDRDFSYDVY